MFNYNKVVDEIVYLLQKNDNKLHLLKLIKELYLADRLSIQERETSISGDNYFSMKNGPVLSNTLNILNDPDELTEYLDRISNKYYFDLVLKQDLNHSFYHLSENDKKYLDEVADKYKDFSEWDLVEYTHSLPEWKNVPDKSREKITFSSILKALEYTESEINDIKAEQKAIECLRDILN